MAPSPAATNKRGVRDGIFGSGAYEHARHFRSPCCALGSFEISNVCTSTALNRSSMKPAEVIPAIIRHSARLHQNRIHNCLLTFDRLLSAELIERKHRHSAALFLFRVDRLEGEFIELRCGHMLEAAAILRIAAVKQTLIFISG